MDNYQYRGARALVLLHEQHLRRFLDIWWQAKAANVALPQVKDPDYVSLETLLRHVLRAARGYLVWTCGMLDLSDPGISPTPDADTIAIEAEEYLDDLLQRWRFPLAPVPEEKFFQPLYRTWWQVDYCIDAMLEHAVMHPQRHALQLEEALSAR